MTQQNKNILYTFLLATLALFIFSASTFLGIAIFEEWFGIIVGVAMMVAAIPLHNIAKNFKFLYFVSYLLNTVGCGFSASAYYLEEGATADLGEFFASTLIPALLLLICAVVFVLVNKRNKRICTLFCVLDIALAALAVYYWITEGETFWSFLFFSAVMAFFYIIALRVVDNDEEFFGAKGSFFRTVSFFSFGIFIIVTIIVAAVLSEGEIFDGFDTDIFGNPNKKKNNIAASAAMAEAVVLADEMSNKKEENEE